MANCPTCEERNPATIEYSKAKPLSTANCDSCDSPFFIPDVNSSGGSSLPHEIIAGDQISVAEIGGSSQQVTVVAYDPDLPMTAILTLVAQVASVVQGAIVLFGKVVDEVNLSWAYSKPNEVSSQTLENDGGLSEPALGPNETVHDYTLQAIQANVEFTITGDDGEAKPDSIGIDKKSVTFGNYKWWGDGARLDSGSTSTGALVTFIEGLLAGAGEENIDVDRIKASLVASGGNLEHFFYFFPKDWGFAIFTQNGIPGGMKRLGAVGGLIQDVPLTSYEGGEQEIQINNGEAADAYHIYMSPSDNINGAIFDVT